MGEQGWDTRAMAMLGGQVSGNLRPCQSPSKSHANRQEVELVFPTFLNQLGSKEKASEHGQWPAEEEELKVAK